MRNENGARAIGSALLAGLIAIIVNTLILELADWIPLITARGGLLKLLKMYAAEPLAGLGSPFLGRVASAGSGHRHFQVRFS